MQKGSGLKGLLPFIGATVLSACGTDIRKPDSTELDFARNNSSYAASDEQIDSHTKMSLKNLEFESPRRIEREAHSVLGSHFAPTDMMEAQATRALAELFPGYEWRFEGIETGFQFSYAKFRQTYKGRDVIGADVVLTLNANADWTTMSSTAVSPKILEKLGSPEGLAQKTILSSDYFSSRHKVLQSRSVVYVRTTTDQSAEAFWAREFSVFAIDEFREFNFWIDEVSGNSVGAFQPSAHLSELKIKGTISPDHPLSTPEEVFFPYVSAFVEGGKTFLTKAAGILDDASVFGNRFQLKLQNDAILVYNDNDIKNSTKPQGFVPVQVDPATLQTDEVSLDEGPGIEERTIFFWVMRAKEYLKTNFKFEKASRQINAIARFQPEPDNAFFLPLTYHLAFGAGKDKLMNTGLARSVIIHEFGHSVIYEKYGLNADYEFIAMNEAMADYLAASITENPIVGENVLQPTLAAKYKRNYIRNIQNETIYPKDYTGLDPHTDGLMFSGALWDMRKTIGSERADRLVHEAQMAKAKSIHEFYLTLIKISKAGSDKDPWSSSPETDAIRRAFLRHGVGARDVVLKKAAPADYTIPWTPK